MLHSSEENGCIASLGGGAHSIEEKEVTRLGRFKACGGRKKSQIVYRGMNKDYLLAWRYAWLIEKDINVVKDDAQQ